MKIFLILALFLSSASVLADTPSNHSDIGELIGKTRARCVKSAGEERKECFSEYEVLLNLLHREMLSDLKKIDRDVR